MNEKVYKYIKEHPHTGANELVMAGYVKMGPPVPLNTGNDCSCYYTTTGKAFSEQ